MAKYYERKQFPVKVEDANSLGYRLTLYNSTVTSTLKNVTLLINSAQSEHTWSILFSSEGTGSETRATLEPISLITRPSGL